MDTTSIENMLQKIDCEIIPPKEFENVVWDVVDEYYKPNKGYQLVKHQIESFNDFILRKVEQIIDGFNPIEINHHYNPETELFKYCISIQVENPTLMKPLIYEKDGSTKNMTPNDARLRNFTYSSAINVDLAITAKALDDNNEYVIETKRINGVSLGKIPIMVKSNYCILKNQNIESNECKYDYGGYFVINGNEKVVISQDRISENKTFVFLNNKVSTYSHIAEIRSVQENRLGVPKITSIKMSAKPNQFGRYIRVNIHHIKTDIPLFILFKAFGLTNDKEIIEYIVHNIDSRIGTLIASQLMACVEEANQVMCQRDAIEYLARYLNITGYPREYMANKINRINIVHNVLEKEVLPHVGKDLRNKALYLGYMVNKLIQCFLGLKEFDDRDSYINKRVDTPGVLLASIFRQYYGKMIKDMKNMIQKEINVGGWKVTNKLINVINKVNVYKIVKSTIIDSGLRYALSTGNWGIKSNKNKQGVAQVLNRMTYNATLSHLRRVNTPIEKSGKLVLPRKLHATQWGVICPAECFDPNTPILMWDGTIKKAQEIVIGDYLIDDKGNSVRVKSTCSGFKGMYEIIPEKKNFITYTVTDNHILTLQVRQHKQTRNHRGKKELMWFDTKELRFRYKDFDNEGDLEQFKSTISDDTVIDVTIEKYLSLPQNVQNNLYLFKSDGINWEHNQVMLDPYILGMWLGDGSSSGYAFATADKELLDKWIEWGKDNDATVNHHDRYKYGISSTINNTQTGIACNKTEQAPLRKLLKQYNLVNNKHIPLEYLVNDRKTRLAVLAGLVDTDGNVRAKGHEIRICQGEKNYRIIYDAEFLARSLGFSCHVNDGICTYSVNGEKRQRPYKELTITGSNLYEIPTVLPKKKLNNFDNPTSIKRSSSFLQSSFELVRKDIQPYVGWQVEGNGRFLLGDMSITHNTPEGASVGLVKNMAMTTNITICSNSTNIRSLIIDDLGVIPFCRETGYNVHMFHNNTRIVVNGDIVGVHPEPHVIYKKLKTLKQKGCINIYTAVIWNFQNNEISISTEGGRCIRPLFIIDNDTGYPKCRLTNSIFNKMKEDKMTWRELCTGSGQMDINDSVIEYMDVEETNAAMIAMNYNEVIQKIIGTNTVGKITPSAFTNMEIHPSLIMGILASCIPFSDHNQAPRVAYQSSMAKQALGIYTANFRHRYDTMGHVLNYAQRPLIKTNMSSILNNDILPSGINAIVAIATYTGFNQEDSVILNKSSVDRGLFTSTYYRTYKELNNKNHSNGEEEFFTKPDTTVVKNVKPYNYDKLDSTGFVPENTFVQSGDVIIGKVMPTKVDTNIQYKDNSTTLKANETGYIDRNGANDKYFTNTNGDGYNFAKVRIRNDRIPTIGDKVSSRHGQKGTCGMMYRQEDMPFTSDGLVPDIIVNPHAIPSRMTIGQLMECIMGKACAHLGTHANATAFNGVNVESIADILEKCGMERYGNEIMYNSRTGEQIHTEIFIGPTYYQRLKHMVQDKVHSRSSNGPIILLTRQPHEGRARDGGLRLGEMEVECHWAHGIMQFLKERFMECSDNYRVFVCKKCGLIANVNPEKNVYHCKNCKNINEFSEVRIPYACKLLSQEVQTMSIGMRFMTG
jgi:DNA-directed RNA polymerase beta subunit